jgi:ATP-dependent DNA helicase DinG
MNHPQLFDALVLVQGEAPPAALLRQFRAHGQAVLVGTKTFWEGVDVAGAALSLVIIDRLPFGVPDDPLWDARCKEVGEAWFSELALPTTLLALKQGVGRLIRRMDDVGPLVANGRK